MSSSALGGPVDPGAYTALGLVGPCSAKEVRHAFRELALRYHPDKGGDENRFKQVLAAYEVLRDEKKKSRIDAQFPNPQNELRKQQRRRAGDPYKGEDLTPPCSPRPDFRNAPWFGTSEKSGAPKPATQKTADRGPARSRPGPRAGGTAGRKRSRSRERRDRDENRRAFHPPSPPSEPDSSDSEEMDAHFQLLMEDIRKREAAREKWAQSQAEYHRRKVVEQAATNTAGEKRADGGAETHQDRAGFVYVKVTLKKQKGGSSAQENEKGVGLGAFSAQLLAALAPLGAMGVERFEEEEVGGRGLWSPDEAPKILTGREVEDRPEELLLRVASTGAAWRIGLCFHHWDEGEHARPSGGDHDRAEGGSYASRAAVFRRIRMMRCPFSRTTAKIFGKNEPLMVVTRTRFEML